MKSKVFTRGGRHRRSTYAMCQEEGMGRIITSGLSFRTAEKGRPVPASNDPPAPQGRTHTVENGDALVHENQNGHPVHE